VAAPAIREPRSSIEARNQKRGSFGTGWCAHLGRITTGPTGIGGQPPAVLQARRLGQGTARAVGCRAATARLAAGRGASARARARPL
jgi:hypothetical protein